jgi:hypothetical protein
VRDEFHFYLGGGALYPTLMIAAMVRRPFCPEKLAGTEVVRSLALATRSVPPSNAVRQGTRLLEQAVTKGIPHRVSTGETCRR